MPPQDAQDLPQGDADATTPTAPAGEESSAENASLPDATSSPDDPSSPDDSSPPDDTSSADGAAAGLPDWAVQKMQEVADANSPAGQDASVPDATSQKPAASAAPAPEAGGPPISDELRESAPNLDLMLDLPLDVTVELGRAEMPLAHVLALDTGAVIQLDRLPGEPLDLLVNGRLVARGEIVVLNDTFAFRITDLIES